MSERAGVYVCVRVFIYVCLCVCESMRDGFVPLCCISTPGILSFQIPFITLNGLFDAQQESCVPLVQARDRVELFYLQMDKNGHGDKHFFLKLGLQLKGSAHLAILFA